MWDNIVSILEVLILVVPVLLTVAFITIAERKTLASMQRRLGPNYVGWYGLLQAFADALKLLLKEYVSPTQANIILFFLGPIITLICSLLGYAVITYGPGLSILDSNLGVLIILAVSSLSSYGILIAGWSANSKYAFLGSLRSTAQVISYDITWVSTILLVILLSRHLNLNAISLSQNVWFIFPLIGAFIIYLISIVAETNRPPFDLAEAESELVSGFMTEHSAVIFVFFFLAEYASIILICNLTSILFLGGYSNPFEFIVSIHDILVFIYNLSDNTNNIIWQKIIYYILEGFIFSIFLGIKTCSMIFLFIWVRASFPRIRFDQLMSTCWTKLLPVIIGFIIFMVCVVYFFKALPL